MKLVVETTKTFPNNISLNLSEKLEDLVELPESNLLDEKIYV
jgi:hypothetical protein